MKINKLLVYLSGYDDEILDFCPKQEYNRAHSLGVFNLLSSLFIFIVYIFSIKISLRLMYFDSVPAAILSITIALLFSVTSLFINRFYSQRPSNNSGFSNTTLIVFPILSTFFVFYPLLVVVFFSELVSSEVPNLGIANGLSGLLERVYGFISGNAAARFISFFLFISLFVMNFLPFIIQSITHKNMRVYHELSALKTKQSIEDAYQSTKIYGNIGEKLNIFEIIKRSIYNNDLRSAINYLNLIADANMLFEERNELITLISRIRDLRNNFSHSTIDNDFASRELSSLKSDLLFLLDKMARKNNLNVPQIGEHHIRN